MIPVIVLGSQQVSCQSVTSLFLWKKTGCKSTLPVIICTRSDYGQHKVYYREEKKKNLFKKPLNQLLLNEQCRCQDSFVSHMALFSLLHSWLTTSRMLHLHFIRINVSSSLPPLHFLSFSTYIFSIIPASISPSPHPSLFLLFFLHVLMRTLPTSGEKDFFQQWHVLSREGDGIGC